MLTHLYKCDSILVFKFITPTYEDKAYKRRAVEEEWFPRKSDQVETKGVRGQIFNFHSAAVAEVNYKS